MGVNCFGGIREVHTMPETGLVGDRVTAKSLLLCSDVAFSMSCALRRNMLAGLLWCMVLGTAPPPRELLAPSN